ncbi:ABC transporter permease [Paenibacillus sp. J2TS4]|uniref:ABC transporter permease n=1 Tax=Paenibacillus sp. J2TS4 TaxID=2807194 RepID=UPI001B13759B|nr:ABC transporter permease [Paenibacillus sp. J2TS4]GIP34411.1 ABC transporter permease [Paenibacillus sp. J2TS4]
MTGPFRWNKWLPPAVAACLFLIIWQLSTVWFDVQKWILPSPVQIIQEGIAQWPRVWMHTMATLQLTLIGFAAGIGIGFITAILLHLFPLIKSACYPFLILTQNIPIIALAPLLLIWFGLGPFPRIIIIIIVCFFPVTISTLNGLKQTDTNMLRYMAMSGASKRQIFGKLELPHAIPSLFSGLKISATYSVMAAFIAEWLSASEGIGTYMRTANSAFRADRVFIGIVIIVCFSMILFGCIVLLEKWLLRWKTSQG